MNELTDNSRGLAVIESDSVVMSMKRASMALAEAVTISQTKKIVDVAAAAEIYAKRQHLSEEAEQMAVTVKVEALRKLGEMLKTAPKATGAKGTGNNQHSKKEVRSQKGTAPTLAELGLTKKESAVAQKLAALPDEAFQQVRDGHVTVAKAIAAVDAAKKPAPTAPAATQPEPDANESPADDTPEPADSGAPMADPRDAQIAELTRELNEALADNTRIGEVFDADDKLAAAMAANAVLAEEVKQLKALLKTANERVSGLVFEKSEMNAEFQKLQRQVARLKKAAEPA